MNARATFVLSSGLYGTVDDHTVEDVPRFLRGFEFRLRPSGEYVMTCFDTLISLSSSADCCVLESTSKHNINFFEP